jgi:D-glycero-alpha-D-manno-heptose 1-phosphate guanylyltransferase
MTSAIVLAGGLGTRLRSEVPDLPKPMAPVNGRPFLAHQLDYWIGQGVRRFILSVGYRHEAISGFFGTEYRGVPVDYAIEETPLGTGGGLLLAAQHVADDEAFLVINGDTYFEVGLAELMRFHETAGADWTFALFRAQESGRYMGMELAPDCRILSLRSGTGTPGRLANGGVYLIGRKAVLAGAWRAGARLSLEDDILPALFAQGTRLFGFECAGRFIDIGVPDDYRRVAQMLPA